MPARERRYEWGEAGTGLLATPEWAHGETFSQKVCGRLPETDAFSS